jgi:hypothetical protein
VEELALAQVDSNKIILHLEEEEEEEEEEEPETMAPQPPT